MADLNMISFFNDKSDKISWAFNYGNLIFFFALSWPRPWCICLYRGQCIPKFIVFKQTKIKSLLKTPASL